MLWLGTEGSSGGGGGGLLRIAELHLALPFLSLPPFFSGTTLWQAETVAVSADRLCQVQIHNREQAGGLLPSTPLSLEQWGSKDRFASEIPECVLPAPLIRRVCISVCGCPPRSLANGLFGPNATPLCWPQH